MMDSETWLNARAALDLGFCDKILYTENAKKEEDDEEKDVVFDKNTMVTNTISAMRKKLKTIPKEPTGTDISQLETRLNLLK